MSKDDEQQKVNKGKTTLQIPFDKLDKSFPFFGFYENKGFADKQQMITIATWMTAFVFSLLGYCTVEYFGGEPYPRTTVFIASCAALSLSLYTVYVIYEFLGHAEENYRKADVIAKSMIQDGSNEEVIQFFSSVHPSWGPFARLRKILGWNYVGSVFVGLLMWSVLISIFSGIAIYLSYTR
jgi:hypothetical protein